MKHLRTLLFALLLVQAAALRADIVIGRVVDAETGEPLPEAKLQVISQSEYAMMVYQLQADTAGCFSRRLEEDRCELRADYPGYYTAKRVFMAGPGKDTLNLGDIKLKPTEFLLRGADVKARARRFTLHGDTVVFNPEAFELSEGARLAELLEKLPGVTQKDGQYYWMDKPMRIQMNGEDLFADNSIFTERLPAEAVDKIKAYNKASELAKRTGKDDGEEDYVLDIQIKPGFLEKWYGSAAATYQTAKRYRLNLDAMYLSMHDPMMACFNWGNNNQNIFNKTMNGYSMGGRDTYGKQLFGAYGYKHQWSRQQGSKELKNYVTLSANAAHNDSWGGSSQTHETFFPGEARTFGLSDAKRNRHDVEPSLEFRARHELDSMTILDATAGWSYGKTRLSETRRSAVFDTNPHDLTDRPLDAAFADAWPDGYVDHLTTRSRYENLNLSERMTTNYGIGLSRFFRNGKFVVGTRGTYSDTKRSVHAVKDIRYYRETGDAARLFEKSYNDMPSHDFSSNVNAGYTQTFAKDVTLNVGYNFDHSRTFEKDWQYLLPDGTDEARPMLSEEEFETFFDPTDSYRSRTTKNSHALGAKATIILGKLVLTPQLAFTRYREKLNYFRNELDTVAVRHKNLWRPSFNVRWKVKRGLSLEGNYSYSATDPELLNTLDYTDSNDPLNITRGNPLLRRSFTHEAMLKFAGNITKGQQSILASLNYTRRVDPVTLLFTYDPSTGAYDQTWDNVRGGDTWTARVSYDRALGEFFRFANEVRFIHSTAYAYLTRTDPQAAFRLNRTRTITFSEKPEISYEQKGLYLGLSARYAIDHRRNSATYDWNNRLTDYTVDIEGRYKLEKWQFWTSLSLDGCAGYAMSEMNRLRPIWEASVKWKVLPAATLELQADDILHKDVFYFSNVTANERTEHRSSNMSQYLSVTFTYNFDAKKAKAAQAAREKQRKH